MVPVGDVSDISIPLHVLSPDLLECYLILEETQLPLCNEYTIFNGVVTLLLIT